MTHPALSRYAREPVRDGDAVLLLDDEVCLELEGLADAWDDEVRAGTVRIVRGTARRVLLAIARPGARLRPEDYRVWRELHQAVGTEVEVLPVQALPAA
jgi:hypothetical protein